MQKAKNDGQAQTHQGIKRPVNQAKKNLAKQR
jgi:hypothetical protein